MTKPIHDMTDSQLLKRFRQDSDPDVFREIVQRHHGMLLGVAKRLVGCRHSAEDVVQATFLVLAKDARRIRQRGSLSSWLYGVAFRIATRLLRKRSRQSLQSMEGLTEPQDEAMIHDDPLERLSDQFEQATVLEELAALPEKVRAPLIMRYLQGKSNSQVAEEMELSIAALEGRLKRGRNQLRFRLARQGITLSMGIGILGFLQDEAFAAESPDLVSELVDVCCAGGTNHSKLLAEQEMTSMLTKQIVSSVCGIVATITVVAAGIGLTSGAMTFAQGNDLSGFGGTESTDADPFGSSELEPTAADPSNAAATETNPFAVAASQSTATRQRSGKKTPWQRLEALGYYGLGSDTAEELKILEALAQPTRFEFYDAPISEVMAVVQERHDIQIVFDARAMEESGVDPSSDTINLDVKDISLQSALNLTLEQLDDLATIPRDEVLVVTSREAAEETLTTRLYKIPASWPLAEKELSNSIMSIVQPDSWDEVGGPGTIAAVPTGLLISNTHEVHIGINKLFAQLEVLYTEQ